jgi:L-talarate/galactarate dehydratase
VKIADVEVAWIQLPLAEGRGLSGGPITHSTDVICRVTTTDGVEGIGEARGAPLPMIAAAIDEVLRPLLLGQDAAATQNLWTTMARALLNEDGAPRHTAWTRHAALGAIAAVDLALWEAKAKAAGLSVCRLLGGQPRPMRAYCSAGFLTDGQPVDEMARETLEEMQERGFRATKIRVGRGDPEVSAARVRAVRELLGPGGQLMVDANQAWTTEEAIEHARAMEPYDLTWLEEPLPSPNRPHRRTKEVRDWDAETGRLGAATSIPIASGENHVSLAETRDLVDKGRVRYVQFDCIKNGGLTEFAKVAAYCEAKGVALAPHHVPHFHVQIAAAYPQTEWIEVFDNAKQHVAWLDLFPGYPETRDGHIEVHDRPGWGFTLDEPFLKERGTLVHWRR